MNNESLIIGENGQVKAGCTVPGQVVLAWKGVYEPGDRIVLRVAECSRFYRIHIDDVMDEALVNVTKPEITFVVPFEEKKLSYNRDVALRERPRRPNRPVPRTAEPPEQGA